MGRNKPFLLSLKKPDFPLAVKSGYKKSKYVRVLNPNAEFLITYCIESIYKRRKEGFSLPEKSFYLHFYHFRCI